MSADFRGEITVEAQEKEDDSILAFYKKLIAMRKKYPVISEGKISFLETGADRVIAYERALGEQKMLVFCNLDGRNQSVRWDRKWREFEILLGNYTMPDGECLSVKDMDGGRTGDGRDGEEFYRMKPYELLVLGKNVI